MADVEAESVLASFLQAVFRHACGELAQTLGAPIEPTLSAGTRLSSDDLKRLGEAPSLLVTGSTSGAVTGQLAFLMPQADAARLAACARQDESQPAADGKPSLGKQDAAVVIFTLARVGAAATAAWADGGGQAVRWPSEATELRAQPLAAGKAPQAIQNALGADEIVGWPVHLGEPANVELMVLLPAPAAEALAQSGGHVAPGKAAASPAERLGDWARLLPVRLPMRVVIAKRTVTVRELLQLAPGRVLPLEKRCDEPLDLYTGSRLVARGDAMVVDERFGFRVAELAHGVEAASRAHKLVR